MTGKDICNFIKKHHLEEVDDIEFDNDIINIRITFESGDWLTYSLFDIGNGAQEEVVFWPGPNNWLKASSKKISFEDAMKMREAGKVTDEYLANYIYKEKLNE